MDQAYPGLFASVVLASPSRSCSHVPHLYSGKKLLSKTGNNLQDIRASSSYCSPGRVLTVRELLSINGRSGDALEKRIIWDFWESLRKTEFVKLYISTYEVVLCF